MKSAIIMASDTTPFIWESEVFMNARGSRNEAQYTVTSTSRNTYNDTFITVYEICVFHTVFLAGKRTYLTQYCVYLVCFIYHFFSAQLVHFGRFIFMPIAANIPTLFWLTWITSDKYFFLKAPSNSQIATNLKIGEAVHNYWCWKWPSISQSWIFNWW